MRYGRRNWAVEAGIEGSVAIRRVGDYAVDYPLVPLSTVAGKTRVMDDAFIEEGGADVTRAFRDDLRPLLGSHLPATARLRGTRVEKAGVLMGDST